MFTLERERWIDSGKYNMHQTVGAEILYDAIFNFYMMVRTRQCISTKVFACSLSRKRQKMSSFNMRECVSSSSPCSKAYILKESSIKCPFIFLSDKCPFFYPYFFKVWGPSNPFTIHNFRKLLPLDGWIKPSIILMISWHFITEISNNF